MKKNLEKKSIEWGLSFESWVTRMLILFLLGTSYSCKKDTSATTQTPSTPAPTPIITEFIESYSAVNQKTGWYQTNKRFMGNFMIDTDPANVRNLYMVNGNLTFSYTPNVQGYFSNRQGSFFGDINGDGKADIFNNYWPGPHGTNKAGYYATWEYEKSKFQYPNIHPGLTGARKFIFNDYYNNGKPTMLIVSSGVDGMPFNGDSVQIVEFSNTLAMSSKIISKIMGYYHSGASADFDNDGDIDVLLYSGGSMTKMGPVYLENRGGGVFDYNPNLITGLGYDFGNSNNYYTVEAFDINSDGFIDILLGGGNKGTVPNRILWGSASSKYSTANQTLLPFESTYSSVMDIAFTDYDKDSDIDMIFLYEVGYQGFGIQVFENNNNAFTDVTKQKVDVSSVANSLWFGWLRIKDFDKDGDVDLIGDGFGYVQGQVFNQQVTPEIHWKNDGKGTFKASIKYQ